MSDPTPSARIFLFYNGRHELNVPFETFGGKRRVYGHALYLELNKIGFRGTLRTRDGISILKNMIDYAPHSAVEGLFLLDLYETYCMRICDYKFKRAVETKKDSIKTVELIYVPFIVKTSDYVTGNHLISAVRRCGITNNSIFVLISFKHSCLYKEKNRKQVLPHSVFEDDFFDFEVGSLYFDIMALPDVTAGGVRTRRRSRRSRRSRLSRRSCSKASARHSRRSRRSLSKASASRRHRLA